MSVDRLRCCVLVLCAVAMGLGGCRPSTIVEVASGFDFLPFARPALTEDGMVLGVRQGALVVGDGVSSTVVDLTSSALVPTALTRCRPARMRSGGEIALVANRTGVVGCPGTARGAYRMDTSGGAPTVLLEVCPVLGDPTIDLDVALSESGTVAFSQIVSGQGAIHRGPASGPVEVFHSGTGTFYNTQSFDMNDAGQIAVEMEYFDGSAGGLMRGVFVLSTPEQEKEASLMAIEKMGIGVQPPVAINAAGDVAFSLNTTLSLPIGGTTYTIEPGVYRSTPTLFGTPKDLTQIAGLGSGYCSFGAVDINDAGDVVFEASRDVGSGCPSGGTGWDGIYGGPDPSRNRWVGVGDARLNGHQYFDSIHLGEVNNARQVSFLTEYSEPLVAPFAIWLLTPPAP